MDDGNGRKDGLFCADYFLLFLSCVGYVIGEGVMGNNYFVTLDIRTETDMDEKDVLQAVGDIIDRDGGFGAYGLIGCTRVSFPEEDSIRMEPMDADDGSIREDAVFRVGKALDEAGQLHVRKLIRNMLEWPNNPLLRLWTSVKLIVRLGVR